MQLKVYKRAEHPISRKNIDPDALKVLYRLYRAGHTAYLVGGGVRDMLLGRTPKDFDVATSARPSQIKKIFKRGCHLVGRRFRLAHVRFGRDKIIEVSTFRREPDTESGALETDGSVNDDGYIYSDNTFGTPEQDALRRDFTINSMFYNIGDFSLQDYCGGLRDLNDRVIRTIGDPQVRFREDPVRMIRAVKFCARLDFRMDAETWRGICDNCSAIANASTARVQEEIRRLLESRCALRSFELLDASGLLAELIPEIDAYLEHSFEQQVPEDVSCRLLWSLLESLDAKLDSIEDREQRRDFALEVLTLPLVIEAGLLRSGEHGEAIREAVNTMGNRLGFSKGLRAELLQTYAVLGHICKGGSRNENQLMGKALFARAFTLYTMLADAGAVPGDALEKWQQKWETYLSKQSGVGKASSRQGAVKRCRSRRTGRRKSSEVSDIARRGA